MSRADCLLGIKISHSLKRHSADTYSQWLAVVQIFNKWKSSLSIILTSALDASQFLQAITKWNKQSNGI